MSGILQSLSAYKTASSYDSRVWARFKASSLSATGNGNTPTQWTDLSGHSRHATQATSARRPTLRSGVSGLTGNTWAMDFQGTDADPHCFSLPDMSALTEGEMFVFLKKDDDDGTNPRRLHQSGSSTDFYYVYLDHGIYDGFGSTVRKTVGDPSPSLTAFHNYNVYSKASDWQCFINNTSIFSTGTNTVGFSTTPLIGGFPTGTTTTRLCKASICEIVILNAKCNSTERGNMNSYFLSEYTGASATNFPFGPNN